MMEQEMRADCKERFEKIVARLEKGDDEFGNHAERITRTETNVDNLTRSLKGVTNALWGVAVSIMGMLVGFVLWFIQNK
jgi:hypothetical protein